MNIRNKLKQYMTPFQWFEVWIVIGFTIYFAIIDKENDTWYLIVNALASICGIFCVVLCAAGKKSQYYWGFINIIAYIVIAMSSKYYGQVMLNALYYLPSQFIGLYMWKKHMNGDKDEVKSKKMTMKQMIIFLVALAVCAALYQILLEQLGGRETWLDSLSFMISVLANALMILRYREQWMLWIIVNVISVIMWIIAGDLIMITMWSVYLLNSIYGYYTWSKMNTYNLNNE